MSATPIISVIAVCRNPGQRLHAALNSVWEQRHIQPELIVIDGASTDGSREWLETKRGKITALVSEPDGGVYEAMNKGIARARGDWVCFLGADDRLGGDMVLSETSNWMRKTEAGIVVGEVAFDDGQIHKLRPHVNAIARNFVPRQGAFYRRSLFEENDAFDTRLGVMADYELHLRLWKNRVRFKPIPLRVRACHQMPRFDWRACREEIRTRHRYFPTWRCWPWDLVSVLRCLMPSR